MAAFRIFLTREREVKFSLLFILCLATWNENVRTSALATTLDHEAEGAHRRDIKAVNWGEPRPPRTSWGTAPSTL